MMGEQTRMSAAATEKGILTGRKVLAMVLAFFGVIIAVNATLTVLAVETLSGTEVASAYSASLAYKNEISAAQRQNERHWDVTAAARRDASGHVSVSVAARDARGTPIGGLALNVRLQRPVDKRFDRDVTLAEISPGTYAAALDDIVAGQWDLVIEADSGGAAMFRSRSRIVLN
jgi:nitrogen fixation protein FixH